MMLVAITVVMLALILAWGGLYFYYDNKTGVVTVASSPRVRGMMINHLQQEIVQGRKQRVIYDLGSGSGQLSWYVARAMPTCKVIGFELSYIPWAISWLRQKALGPKNLSYYRADFMSMNVGDADSVLLYLRGKVMPTLSEKLWLELRSGTLVVSNAFPLHAPWEPFVYESYNETGAKLYAYRRP